MYAEVQVLHGCVDANLTANCCKYNVASNETDTLKLKKKSFVRINILPLVISTSQHCNPSFMDLTLKVTEHRYANVGVDSNKFKYKL